MTRWEPQDSGSG